MGVRVEIGTVTGGLALQVDLLDEAALHESLQAVVHGGQRDAGQLGFDAGEDLVSGGVVALVEEDAIDEFALGG